MTEKILMSEFPTLTTAQERTVQAVRNLIAATGMPPSLEEIGCELGCTLNTARASVRILETKGYLTRQKGKNRSIRLTAAATSVRCGDTARRVA